MKYVKMLGLLAVAAAAMMAFAGSASAITVTEATNDHIDVGDVIKASSSHTELTGTVPITCTGSVVEGTVTNAGGGAPTQNLVGNVTSLTWTGCTATVTTVKGGTLTMSAGGTTGTGTLTSNGAEVTALTHSIFLGTRHCIYVTNNTHLGSVSETGTLTIKSAGIPEKATDTDLCKDDAVWHGDYQVTSPAGFKID